MKLLVLRIENDDVADTVASLIAATLTINGYRPGEPTLIDEESLNRRRVVDSASADERVRRLQKAVRLANEQLAPNFAPLTGFMAVSSDPELLAEVEEALRQ